MPLRKQGTIIPSTALAFVAAAALIPTSASAGISSYSWNKTPTPVATPVPTPVPTPVATPTPTPTPTATATATAAATTTTGCTPVSTSASFSKFGDSAQYFKAPGGDFDNTSGWKFTLGAKVVSGNDNLGVTGGSKSLELGVGATATSPAFCVDDSLPSFRFASKVSSLDGGYAAVVIYRNTDGKITQSQFLASKDGDYYNGAASWTPSPVAPLATKIPLLDGGGKTASVQLMFIGTQKAYGMFVGAKAYIDSVMIDPYRRG